MTNCLALQTANLWNVSDRVFLFFLPFLHLHAHLFTFRADKQVHLRWNSQLLPEVYPCIPRVYYKISNLAYHLKTGQCQCDLHANKAQCSVYKLALIIAFLPVNQLKMFKILAANSQWRFETPTLIIIIHFIYWSLSKPSRSPYKAELKEQQTTIKSTLAFKAALLKMNQNKPISSRR